MEHLLRASVLCQAISKGHLLSSSDQVLQASMIDRIFQVTTLKPREVKGAAQSHAALRFKTELFDFKAQVLQGRCLSFCSVPMILGKDIMGAIVLDLAGQQLSCVLALNEHLLCVRLSTSFH